MVVEGNFYKGFFFDLAEIGDTTHLLLFVYDTSYFPDYFKPYTVVDSITTEQEAKEQIDKIRDNPNGKKLPPIEFPNDLYNRNLWRFPITARD